MANIVGKQVLIKTGMYKGEWGIVTLFENDQYHVALWGDENAQPVFDRKELRVKRSAK